MFCRYRDLTQAEAIARLRQAMRHATPPTYIAGFEVADGRQVMVNPRLARRHWQAMADRILRRSA